MIPIEKYSLLYDKRINYFIGQLKHMTGDGEFVIITYAILGRPHFMLSSERLLAFGEEYSSIINRFKLK